MIDLEAGSAALTLSERRDTRIPDHLLIADRYDLTERERQRIEIDLRNLDRILDMWERSHGAGLGNYFPAGLAAALTAATRHRRPRTVHVVREIPQLPSLESTSP